jgi:hypothetical protein
MINLIDYKTLYYSMNEYNRSRVLEKYYKSDYKLYCGCRGENALPIKVVKRGDMYILQSYPNYQDFHLDNCDFPTSGNGSGGSSVEAWQESSDGDVTVKVEGFNYIAEHKTKSKSSGGGKSNSSSGESQRRKTFSAFAKNVLMASHQYATHYASKNGRTVDLEMLLSFIYTKSKKIHFNKKLTLSTLLYRAGSDYPYYMHSLKLKKKNLNPLVVGMYQFSIKDGDDALIVLTGADGSDTQLEFKCSLKQYRDALDSNLVQNSPLVCFAFVKDQGKDDYRAVDMAFVPVSSGGIYVESEYERTFFNACHDAGLPVYKPYRSVGAFGPYMPDGIAKGKKDVIIEVYGRSLSDEDYHFRKSLKEQRYIKLKNYRYISWSPYKSEAVEDSVDKLKALLIEG